MSKTETQYDVIKRLHRGKMWVCANDYRSHYIPYFWKRQKEMKGFTFQSRPCEHGTKRGLDYKMIEVKEHVVYRPSFTTQERKELTKLFT